MQVVSRQHFAPTDLSVAAQATAIKAANAQAILTCASGTIFGTVLHGMRDVGLDIPTAASSANMVYEQLASYAGLLPRQLHLYFAATRGIVEDLGLRAGPVKDTQNKYFAAFRAAKLRPEFQATLVWDQATIIVDALRQATQPDGGEDSRLHRKRSRLCRNRRHLLLSRQRPARHRAKCAASLSVERAGREVHGRQPPGGKFEVTELTMQLVAGELTDPILAGEVAVKGDVQFTVTAGTSVDGNSRQMLSGAFDVAEMSFATYLKAREPEGRDLIGLPIFTGRGFLQPGLLVSTASGITRPEDIAGRRVGVPQFWMTSSVWHRGILLQQHGVKAGAVEWYTASEERFEGVTFPPGVKINRLAEDIQPNAALEQGLVDVVMVPHAAHAGRCDPARVRAYADSRKRNGRTSPKPGCSRSCISW